MKVWLDAQLSPSLAGWLSDHFDVVAQPVVELGLRDAKDVEIFFAAREADAVVLTKDADFMVLLERHGPPPRVVWLTMGNTSNRRLREILKRSWSDARALIEQGEALVELRARDE